MSSLTSKDVAPMLQRALGPDYEVWATFPKQAVVYAPSTDNHVDFTFGGVDVVFRPMTAKPSMYDEARA